MTSPDRSPSNRNSPLAEVFREHRRRLFQYLRRRLANENDAEDLAQEAYLRLLRVSRTELVRDPQAYLYRVARHLVYEHHADSLPPGMRAEDEEFEALVDPAIAPEVAAEQAAVLARIEEVMAELSPQRRAVVLLFCREGLSQSMIAERVGLSKSMVQKYLAGGIAHCRKRLRLNPRTGQPR